MIRPKYKELYWRALDDLLKAKAQIVRLETERRYQEADGVGVLVHVEELAQ
jgi:hypothetical protein